MTSRVLPLAIGLVGAAAAFVACGGGGADTSSSTSGSSSSASTTASSGSSTSSSSSGSASSTSSSSTSTSSSTSSSSGAGGAGPVIYGGFVNLRMQDDGTGITYVGTTQLSKGGEPSEVVVASCDGAQETSGDCCYRATPNPPGAPLVEVDAGTVTITNDTTSVTLATMSFAKGLDIYGPALWKTPSWSAGDVIRASAPGAMADAFQLMINAPTRITGMPSSWTSPITITRSAGFHATWTPNGAAGEKEVLVLTGAKPNAPHGLVVCEVPDAQGALDVAPSLLAHFEAGDACQPCMLERLSSTKATQGQTAVALRAFYDALITGGFD